MTHANPNRLPVYAWLVWLWIPTGSAAGDCLELPDASLPDLVQPSAQQTGTSDASIAQAREFVRGILASRDADVVLRWSVAIVDPSVIFESPDDPADDGDRPAVARRCLKVTPFPGSTFIARLTELTDDSGYFLWEGTIVSGGTGTVSISAFREDDVLKNVEIGIYSDAGNFGIGETRHGQWYYVIEANPHYRLPDLPNRRQID